LLTLSQARTVEEADCIRIVPKLHRGQGDIVPFERKDLEDPNSYTFSYQRDTYILISTSPLAFARLPYPSSSRPPLESFLQPHALPSARLDAMYKLYGQNEFNIPIPSFVDLFSEQATAPFFVFQIFCVALWCLDEYWYYSLFTLFMLVVFECTVVWQVCHVPYFSRPTSY
jgi:cation-transporting ATPase 13A1